MYSLFKYRYSLLAGACAAGGSFFGKLPSVLAGRRTLLLLLPINTPPEVEYLMDLVLRTLPLVLMVLCNVLNWRYFLKALQTVDQTLTATVLTAATNYMLSFILAAAIYKEPFTLLSAAGGLLLVAGLWFLCNAPEHSSPGNKEKLI